MEIYNGNNEIQTIKRLKTESANVNDILYMYGFVPVVLKILQSMGPIIKTKTLKLSKEFKV